MGNLSEHAATNTQESPGQVSVTGQVLGRSSGRAANGEIGRVVAELAARKGSPSTESRELVLQNGRVAVLDLEDWRIASRIRWQAKNGGNHGHVEVCVDTWVDGRRKTIRLHRVLAGAAPGQVVDHVNGNSLDNRRSNLRITDHRGNCSNVCSSKRQKRGGYKGVTWHKASGKWEASCASGERRANGKRRKTYLGLFTDPIDAAKAYDAEALRAFGEFAALNFPRVESLL